MDGGPATDHVNAGAGDDVVRVRDGAADAVTCGPGRDRVTADRADAVTGDCEAVHRR
jgi:hypothetical protein